jgi:hypothetical protein
MCGFKLVTHPLNLQHCSDLLAQSKKAEVQELSTSRESTWIIWRQNVFMQAEVPRLEGEQSVYVARWELALAEPVSSTGGLCADPLYFSAHVEVLLSVSLAK